MTGVDKGLALSDKPGCDVDDVFFPTNLTADTTNVGIKNLKVTGITTTPPNPLDIRGNQLAVSSHDPSILAYVYKTIKKRSAPYAVVQFIASHDDIGPGLTSCFS